MWGATTISRDLPKAKRYDQEFESRGLRHRGNAVSRDGKYLLTGDNGGWDIIRGGYGTGKYRSGSGILSRRQIVKMDAGQTIISVALSPDINTRYRGFFRMPDRLENTLSSSANMGYRIRTAAQNNRKYSRFRGN